jgi:hypothetical protein
LATLEAHDVVTGGQFGHDRLHRLDIVGVDAVDERPGQHFLQRVSQAADERRIGALQVPVEPRNEERIMRKVEDPYPLVVKRPAPLSHNNLV